MSGARPVGGRQRSALHLGRLANCSNRSSNRSSCPNISSLSRKQSCLVRGREANRSKHDCLERGASASPSPPYAACLVARASRSERHAEFARK